MSCEANLSAQQKTPQAYPRLPGAHAHAGRQARYQPASSEGPEAPGSERWTHLSRSGHRRPRGATSLDEIRGERPAAFGQRWRIRRRSEFLRIQGQGRKFVTDHFLIFSKPNAIGHPRIGITVSRKVGNAVLRNRIKRLVREVFRIDRSWFQGSHDVVIVARRSAAGADFQAVKREVRRFCEQCFRRGAGSGSRRNALDGGRA